MSQPPRYPPQDPATQPPLLYAAYRSTVGRSPRRPPLPLEHTPTELTGPGYDGRRLGPLVDDLTTQGQAAPIGERIIVWGQVIDEQDRPVPQTLVEIWQANAAGRYAHAKDQHDAPLDPNFDGSGRVLTDAQGFYRFTSIKPGPYPWRNHPDAWRPAHIHFSVFGPCLVTRLITQMYFQGDPLLPFDPVLNSVGDHGARDRLIARYTPERDKPEWALAYRFDIVLRGPKRTPENR